MRAPAAIVAVVLAAALPAVAGAQDAALAAMNPIGPRLEVGGGAGLMVAYPEISALVSVPIGPQTSFELAVGWMPRIVYDVEHALVQAQFRLPFGAQRRSRRSLLLGVPASARGSEARTTAASGATTPTSSSRTPASACSGRWAVTSTSVSTRRVCSRWTPSCRWWRGP